MKKLVLFALVLVALCLTVAPAGAQDIVVRDAFGNAIVLDAYGCPIQPTNAVLFGRLRGIYGGVAPTVVVRTPAAPLIGIRAPAAAIRVQGAPNVNINIRRGLFPIFPLRR